MSKTPKFFTKKWYPWNIIILVLSILLIAVLIWGGVTNWKFIPSATRSTPTPRPTPPNIQTMTLTIAEWNDKGALMYGYIPKSQGSLNPNTIKVYKKPDNSSSTISRRMSASLILITEIQFWSTLSWEPGGIKPDSFGIYFSPQSFADNVMPCCAINIIIKGNPYKFMLQNKRNLLTRDDKKDVGFLFDLPSNFPELSGLVDKPITVQFIQN